jgi:hypothetical protein
VNYFFSLFFSFNSGSRRGRQRRRGAPPILVWRGGPRGRVGWRQYVADRDTRAARRGEGGGGRGAVGKKRIVFGWDPTNTSVCTNLRHFPTFRKIHRSSQSSFSTSLYRAVVTASRFVPQHMRVERSANNQYISVPARIPMHD